MSAPGSEVRPAPPTSDRRWSTVDRAMLHLVRLVLDEAWHPATAAAHLRDLIPDPRVLRHLAARVERALFDRPSPVGERAARTLALALALVHPSPELEGT